MSRRSGGVRASTAFRKVARDVTHISQMQLDDELLTRLGQKPGGNAEPETPPDFVFYTGCNVLKTPHIALLALDIMDTLGVTYQVLGGPSHCCGVVQMRTGDVATSGRFAENTMDKLARSKSGQGGVVVSELSCAIHRDDVADGREDPRLEAVRDDSVHALSCAAISTGSGRFCANLFRCASPCTAIPGSRAWSRPPRTSSRPCRASNWSTSSSPRSA
jgi:hypothetical protein